MIIQHAREDTHRQNNFSCAKPLLSQGTPASSMKFTMYVAIANREPKRLPAASGGLPAAYRYTPASQSTLELGTYCPRAKRVKGGEEAKSGKSKRVVCEL